MDDWWLLTGGHTLRVIAQGVDDARVAFNRQCVHLEAWQIVAYTISLACLFMWCHRQLKAERSMSARIRAGVSFCLQFFSSAFATSHLRSPRLCWIELFVFIFYACASRLFF